MKTDPHILDLRKDCIKTANMIPEVIVNKTHVLITDKERYNTDLPELIAVIKKAPLWDGHLSLIKRFLDRALMQASQIDARPAVPMANAYYGGHVAKTPRMILEAKPPQITDRAAERLPEGHRDKKCTYCHKFIYRFDKHKNRIRPNKETGNCPTCIKYRAMLQKERTAKQKKSDSKAARRKAKENRGKRDPEGVKAREKRHADLRSGKFH